MTSPLWTGDAVVVDRWPVVHDPVGIDATLKRLGELGPPEEMLVVIEATVEAN